MQKLERLSKIILRSFPRLVGIPFTGREILSFCSNFQQRLHWKLLKWQLPVQQMTKYFVKMMTFSCQCIVPLTVTVIDELWLATGVTACKCVEPSLTDHSRPWSLMRGGSPWEMKCAWPLGSYSNMSWWHHQMEIFSALLVVWKRNKRAIITSKRRFGVIITCLLRCVFAGLPGRNVAIRIRD